MNTSFPPTGFANPGFSPAAWNSCGPNCSPFCVPGTDCFSGSAPYASNFNQPFAQPFNQSFPQATGWNQPWGQFSGWNQNPGFNSFNGFNGGNSFNGFGGTPFGANSQNTVPFGGMNPFGGFNPSNAWNPGFSPASNWNAWNFNNPASFSPWSANGAPSFGSPFGGFNSFSGFNTPWNTPFAMNPWFAGAAFNPMGFAGMGPNAPVQTTTKGNKKNDSEVAANASYPGMYPVPFGYAGFPPFGFFNPAAYQACDANCKAA